MPPGWADAAAVAGALGLWLVVTWTAARSVGDPPWSTATWGRWDTGLYRQIAQEGYSLERCGPDSGLPPDDWCGTAGWFPGLPYGARVIGWAGFGVSTSMRVVAVGGHVAAYSLLWFGLLRRLDPRPAAVAAMALAAVFPASVYQQALFPISLVLAGFFACLWAIRAERWWLAGVAGALAVVSYPSGIVLLAACVVVALDQRVGDARRRVAAAAAVGLPLVAAYAAVLVNFERTAGRWDAWFLVQAKYDYAAAWPWVTVWRQLRWALPDDEGVSWAIGAQTALVLVVVALAVAAAVVHWSRLATVDLCCLALVAALWLAPLTLGGQLSLYRAESLLVPAVVLVARLPSRVVVAVAVAATPVAFAMARLFFQNVLI